MEIIKKRLTSGAEQADYQPHFYRLGESIGRQQLEALLTGDGSITVHDEIEGQLRELIKSLHPGRRLKDSEYQDLIKGHLNGQDIFEYGVWVYYPWSSKLIHLLDEEEFVEIRTNRNRYKITSEEQAVLRQKKIGIVGLSVGQSIALTLATERTCGELRLADFDIAELSNLNRIRTGVQNLGLNKTVIAAREIAEIDPYLKVKVFSEGLTQHNMDEFFTAGGKVDLLVEVCDGLDIKIVSRFKARELGIPVVMDTNDRGMLDVERFDLEPKREILHGLAQGLDPENIKDLTNEEKIPYILRMVGAETISTRLKASMIEVEQSINTWPQLASSVVLGGAVVTDVCRRIFLDQYHESGRYYIDIDQIVADREQKVETPLPSEYFAPPELSRDELIRLADDYKATGTTVPLSREEQQQLVEAAILAPSGGNSQPWKFVYRHDRLFVFHDLNASYSFLDYNSLGAFLALGAAIENMVIRGEALDLECSVDHSVFKEAGSLVAVLSFRRGSSSNSGLARAIGVRLTNRNIAQRQMLDRAFYHSLTESIIDYDSAQLDIIDDWKQMQELGDILATTEKLVLIHPRGHYDAFKKELRWTAEENIKKRDGLDVATLGISKGEVAALRIANDRYAIDFVRDTIRGGNAFKKMAQKAVDAASALCVVSMPACRPEHFLLGGRAVERIWLEATMKQVSVQPITQFAFLLARLTEGQAAGLDDHYKVQFNELKERFHKLLPHLENRHPVFIFRLCKAEEPKIKALRKAIDSVFIY